MILAHFPPLQLLIGPVLVHGDVLSYSSGCSQTARIIILSSIVVIVQCPDISSVNTITSILQHVKKWVQYFQITRMLTWHDFLTPLLQSCLITLIIDFKCNLVTWTQHYTVSTVLTCWATTFNLVIRKRTFQNFEFKVHLLDFSGAFVQNLWSSSVLCEFVQ